MADPFEIVKYPDPILRHGACEVEEVDSTVRDAVDRMFDIMRSSNGVGLAAPQIGIGRKIIVFKPSPDQPDEQILINPSIVERRGTMEAEEGCLSFPGVWGTICRSAHIVVTGYDLKGNDLKISASDFLARVLQHEIDHVEGMLFVDRMTPECRVLVRDALKALEDAYSQAVAEGGRRS